MVRAGEPAAPTLSPTHQLANHSYRLSASLIDGVVNLRLDDLRSGACIADGPCMYHAAAKNGPKSDVADRLASPSITVDGQTLTIRGKLLGLDVEHRFTTPKEQQILEERVVVHNSSNQLVALTDFEVGMRRRVADKDGKVFPEVAADRLVAVPFRHRAVDPKGKMQDYSLQEVVSQPGVELQMDDIQCPCERPSRHRVSEGWAWTHGGRVLCIFKFCQEHMQFSVVSKHQDAEGACLRFGGATMLFGEPADLCRMAPGATVDLGVVRYETLQGGYQEAMYAFRAMLDEKGCRFPKDFNPPVHWEQLYDMDGAWNDRLHPLHQGDRRERGGKGRGISLRSVVSRSRLGYGVRFIHLG